MAAERSPVILVELILLVLEFLLQTDATALVHGY